LPYLTVGSRRVYYVTRGRSGGTRLAFIHGAGGNRLLWGSQVRGLAPAGRVVALDLPGHGLSEGPAIASIDGYADVTTEALTHLVGPWILVGHSMGGGVALQVALQHPDLVAGLVLLGTGGRLRVVPQVLGGLQTDCPGTVKGITAAAFAPASPEFLRRRGAAALLAVGQATLLADFQACDGFDVLARLGEIRTPCLVLCGTDDRMTPPKYSEALTRGIVGARLQLIPSAGHMAMLEAPAAVTEAVLGFLAAL
jgi:pimeloyl-ACP methyl ester carboxylesterase